MYPTHCHRSPAIIPEFDSFMFLSIYFHHRLSFHLCSCLFLHITHRSNCVSIYLSICLYLSISPVMICKVVFYSHQYICLSIYLSVCLSIYLFMYQSIYTLFFICMFFFIFIHQLFMFFSVYSLFYLHLCNIFTWPVNFLSHFLLNLHIFCFYLYSSSLLPLLFIILYYSLLLIHWWHTFVGSVILFSYSFSTFIFPVFIYISLYSVRQVSYFTLHISPEFDFPSFVLLLISERREWRQLRRVNKFSSLSLVLHFIITFSVFQWRSDIVEWASVDYSSIPQSRTL